MRFIVDMVRSIKEAMSRDHYERSSHKPRKFEVAGMWSDNAKRLFFGWQSPSYGNLEEFNRGLAETAERFAQPDNLWDSQDGYVCL